MSKRTSAYELGKQHGMAGAQFLAHRNGKLYDSASMQASYQRGFSFGRQAATHGLQQKLADTIRAI